MAAGEHLAVAAAAARALVAVLAVLVVAPASRALAFNAPEDSAGPVAATIEGPGVVTTTGKPVPYGVRVENSGAAAIEGTVRLGLIDDWRAEPAGAVAFRAGPNGSVTLRFDVVPGPGTHAALYPLHAWVEFRHEGRSIVAHPVFIIEARVRGPEPETPPAAWRPVRVAEGGGMRLLSLPARRVVVRVFGEGEEARALPVGWMGSDEPTRAAASSGTVARGDTRRALWLHPPWRDGRAGTIMVEWPVALPDARELRLRFGNAIRDSHGNEPPSDGVTFRVRVAAIDAPAGTEGEVVFERHTAAKRWVDGEVDLSAYAGRTVRVQLESHPGPRRDTTCDQSFWAQPTVVAGRMPEPPAFPPPPGARFRRLGTLKGEGKGDGGRWEVGILPGRRGLLDSVIRFEQGARRLMFRGFGVNVGGDALENSFSSNTVAGIADERTPEGLCFRHRFAGPGGGFALVGELACEGACLRGSFRLEGAPPARPWRVVRIEDVSAGEWSASPERVNAGAGNVIVGPEAFRLAFDGHRLSTSFAGFDFEGGASIVQAVDAPPRELEVDPARRVATLHAACEQTVTFVPCADVWAGVRAWRDANGLRAAGGVGKLAGRFVFDLWGGRYAESERELRRSFRYGLTDSAVVWHNWQRWGYDYRLPDIWPPNPRMGTPDEFRSLADACREAGVLFAPHDNYIDMYPDAEGFSYDEIAFTSGGRPVKAWFNKGRGAQSYRFRADRVRKYLDRNVRLIREGAHPSAFFIDVWSSIRPYPYWTREGEFFDELFTRQVWGDAFAWIRKELGDDAPQISESGHDQLIGYLDGAQTNHLRVDASPPAATWSVWNVRCRDAERVPWFDAAHHDRFVLHGAGYGSRYAGGLDARLHGILSDDYVTTEVLTGRPAMVPTCFSRDVVRKYWLLHGISRALARLGRVEFVEGDVHRQRVLWEGGGEVRVNRAPGDWHVEGRALPEYGFHARIPTEGGEVEAAIERRRGVIVEWSCSREAVYANARPVKGTAARVSVSADEPRSAGGRAFDLTFRWKADEPLTRSMRVFVHFVDKEGNIRFQADRDQRPAYLLHVHRRPHPHRPYELRGRHAAGGNQSVQPLLCDAEAFGAKKRHHLPTRPHLHLLPPSLGGRAPPMGGAPTPIVERSTCMGDFGGR
ncbi:MAG: hypothetical protein ACYTKD_15560 [Planctomycetota bacterium]|jgi:hypothetical protein